jgi:cephalosporin hydroxylase
MRIILRKLGINKMIINFLRIIRTFRFSIINIERTFPVYTPGSAGDYKVISILTIDNINSTLESLSSLATNDMIDHELKKFYQNDLNPITQELLKNSFIFYGSDKATTHDYYIVYANILNSITNPYKIFEIGLGSNNVKIASNMGKKGRPGASLRSFKDVYTNSNLFGADFDKRVLFSEERIQTYFVDQTEVETFETLKSILTDDFDLMIDDGLHSISANLNSLKFFMGKVRIGGYIVIEDIKSNNKDVWTVVSNLILPEFRSTIIKTKSAYIFIAQRLI